MSGLPTSPVETQSLPLLPLRDVVVFPHMVIPLFVGRPKSIKALEVAMEAELALVLANPFDRHAKPVGAQWTFEVVGEA